ncbi:MAG: hypothetical protein HYY40_03205 [Bacteroidetes bacterium]|nr:hypothetical protein [Bacteroidota bacterium]
MKHLFILLFLFGSCSVTKKNNSTNNKNSDTYENTHIEMTKTACHGKCPVYKITIQGNGKAIYDGQNNVDKIGKYEKLLSKEEIDNLIKKFEEVKFFEFKNEYFAKATDLPTTYLEFTHKEQNKKKSPHFQSL